MANLFHLSIKLFQNFYKEIQPRTISTKYALQAVWYIASKLSKTENVKPLKKSHLSTISKTCFLYLRKQKKN